MNTSREQEVQDNAGARYDTPRDMYDITSTDVVQEQTQKRLNETYRAQQQRLRTERRLNITFAVCASILALCVLIAQIYQQVHR